LSAAFDRWAVLDATERAARKQAYVRTVRAGRDTYVVGSGIYLDD